MDETFGAPAQNPTIGESDTTVETYEFGDSIDPLSAPSSEPEAEPWQFSEMPSVADPTDGLGEPATPAPDLTVPDPSIPDLAPDPAPQLPVIEEPAAPVDTPEPSEPMIDLPPTDEVPEDGVSGAPGAWSERWFFQEVNGYCGPSAAAQLVSEYTGLDITDPQQLVDRAMELGLFYNGDPSQGMVIGNLEKLLEDQGVPSHLENSSIDDLKAKLSEGVGVIAQIDSGEIWDPAAEIGEDNKSDHVVVVAGIDDARGVVILSDPGNPDGNQFEISISQFDDAWADSKHTMLVADQADPDLCVPGPEAAAEVLEPRPWALLDLIGAR